MKKSYIVFAVFTTFTQAVFSVLLFWKNSELDRKSVV